MVNINRKELSLDIRSELDASRQHLINNTSKEITLNKDSNTVNAKIKTPVNIKRIDGKTVVNLVPLFNSTAWKVGTNATVLAPNKLGIKANNTLTTTEVEIQVKPNTTYTSMAKNVNVSHELREFNGSTLVLLHPNGIVKTFTTSATTNKIRITLFKPGSDNQVYSIEDIVLAEGSVVQPFVSNIKGLTNPTIVNETNNTSLVIPTTLYAGEYIEQSTNGELVKYKKYNEVQLDDKLVYTYFTSSANNTAKRINITAGLTGLKIDASLSDLKDHRLIKYNGILLDHGSTTLADNFNNVDNQLAISVPNADSGWGPDYIPTTAEIRAYFLGWKMYDKNSNPDGDGVYNGSGEANKAWVGLSGWDGTNYTGPLGFGTFTLPTTSHSYVTYNRLIYELVTPVQEVIQPYGDLMIEKGDNTIKLSVGRIVGERALFGSDAVAVYTNETVYNKLFKYKIGALSAFYENSIPFKKFSAYKDVYSNGNMTITIRKDNFNQSAAYTVDYEPLYTWEVTVPINTAQITYFETLQAVASEIIKDLENIGARGSRSAKLISDLVSHTNELDPHAEQASYTIYVGPTRQFKRIQDAIDSIKKNLGGRSINIIIDPGYYAEFVRINGFRNGYISIYGEATNRLAVTIEHIRVSYCEATIVVNHVKIEANRDNGIFIANSMYTRIYNSAIVRSAAFAGTKYGIAGENSNVMIDSCDISAFEVAVHSAVGATVYVHQSTGTNNKTGLACYGGAVVAKSGTMPGATITAESSWAGGVIR